MSEQKKLMMRVSSEFARFILSAIATMLAAAVLLTAPAPGAVLYSNGAINGDLNAWSISDCTTCDPPAMFLVTDSFVLTAPATITGVTFGDWVIAGATPETVYWGISASPFGGGTSVSLTSSLFCSASSTCGGRGEDVYSSSFTLDLSLGAGTYWLTLDGGTASAGGLQWDENGGSSSAEQWRLPNGTPGAIPSESFTIDGSAVPEPGSLALGGSGLLLLLAAGLLRKLNGSASGPDGH
jgi:hypothetical protein